MEFSSFRGLIRLTGRELDFETREEIDHRGEIWDYASFFPACFIQRIYKVRIRISPNFLIRII